MADLEQAKKAAGLAVAALEDTKAEDIRMIDISSVSVLADYFIIASGKNTRQIQAMADRVQEQLGKAGVAAKSVEGYNEARWILIDFGDVIVHVFDHTDRVLYDLERIWRDGKEIDPAALKD